MGNVAQLPNIQNIQEIEEGHSCIFEIFGKLVQLETLQNIQEKLLESNASSKYSGEEIFRETGAARSLGLRGGKKEGVG